MNRTQVSLEPRHQKIARRLAEEQGVSLSQIVRDALESADEQREADRLEGIRSLESIFGIVKGADPNASVDHDRILYEREDER